jgi:hypothetical protein
MVFNATFNNISAISWKFWENIGSNERYTSTPYDGAADSRQIKQINKQINTNHKKSHDSHVSICITTFC